MLGFLKLIKKQPNNQSPGAIPGYLFRDGQEEDGFVIIGDSVPEENFHSGYGDKVDMGTGISSMEGDKNIIHVDVRPAAATVDNINTRSSETTLQHDPITDELATALRRNSNKTVVDTWNIKEDDSVCESYMDCLRDVPFHISEKYFLPPLADVNLISITPLNLFNFQYDFHTERACINSPVL